MFRAETPYEIPFPPIIGDQQHQIGREAGRDVIGDIVDLRRYPSELKV